MRIQITKLLGIFATGIGLLVCGLLSVPLYYAVLEVLKEGDIVSGFAVWMIALIILPANYSVYYGIRLLKRSEPKFLMRATGFVLAVLSLGITFFVNTSIFKENDNLTFSLLLLVTSFAAIPIYIFLVKLASKQAGLRVADWRELITKSVIFLMALEIWAFTGDLARAFNPIVQIEEVEIFWRVFAQTLLPIVFAWAFYKFFAQILDARQTPNQGAGPHSVKFS